MVTKVKSAVFEERFLVYSQLKEILLKLCEKDYTEDCAKIESVICKKDSTTLRYLIWKSAFLFDDDKRVVDLLNNVKYGVDYYLSHFGTKEDLAAYVEQHKKIYEKLRHINDEECEAIFKPHLMLSLLLGNNLKNLFQVVNVGRWVARWR